MVRTLPALLSTTFRVATVKSIPIRLHWSFPVAVAATSLVGLVRGDASDALSALALAVALFGSVVLHELGHALAARRFGIRTAHITLYPFGGVAAIERLPKRPREEILVALAGPATNALLAFVFLPIGLLLGSVPIAVVGVLNVLMGLFNLLPAFPMDGGRVLRALLSTSLGHVRASRLAIRTGRGFAWAFLLLGVALFQPGLLMVGGFLHVALTSEQRRLDEMVRSFAKRRWPAPVRRNAGTPVSVAVLRSGTS